MNLESRINALRGVEPARVVTAPQLFPTPSHTADQMVSYLNIEEGDKILEPNGGTGQLVKALMRAGATKKQIYIAEINNALCNQLSKDYGRVYPGDFLERGAWELGGPFDYIVMNPPFKNGEDIKHILHAKEMLKDGGTLVAICANGLRQQAQLMSIADHWEELPAGSFKGEGTNVNTALCVITN